MAQMIIPLLRNEIAKTIRCKLPYLGVVAVAVVCVLTFVFTKNLPGGSSLNGWAFVGFTMQAGFADVGLIFLAIFSSLLISEENGSGTLRTILPLPIYRREFYLAKVLMGLIYMVALYVTALIVSSGLAMARYHFGPIEDSAGMIYSKRETLINFLAAFFLSWLPGSAAVLFGILLSSIARKGGQTVGVAVGLIILIEAVKHVAGIDRYVFTSYMGSSWLVFHELAQGVSYEWFPEIWKMITVPLISVVVFFTAGWVIFCRRDIQA